MPNAAELVQTQTLPATDDGFLALFVRHAAATPDRVYARIDGRDLTFGALDERSALLTGWLRGGIWPDPPQSGLPHSDGSGREDGARVVKK